MRSQVCCLGRVGEEEEDAPDCAEEEGPDDGVVDAPVGGEGRPGNGVAPVHR